MISMKSTKGFTLIELLVVIAIIGILSSVVLASLNSARQKGRDARRVSDLKQLQLALELFYDANPSTGYPAALSAANLVTPGYISVIPTDPGTGDPYGYVQTGSGSGYYLGAELETAGQTSALSGDNDDDQDISINGSSVNCEDDAGGDDEVIYCVTP
jgi:prepilin-type N-terminal cleavage/methylation domain-containing protein